MRPRRLQVWTYKGRVAFVLSITEKGMPVVDGIKLQRLRQLVLGEHGLGCIGCWPGVSCRLDDSCRPCATAGHRPLPPWGHAAAWHPGSQATCCVPI